ncbi:MAG: septal ring lytic transglycosylase RlpA family protein [Geobacteraceae bacterium]|nr:septal ring lytic transglycosylase RlpA family protein [Geobacteraceae bacterium]NTW80648.1 septal ring lytic transglycosylase RlpA family protein [Geobacteraceae bacterium]
MKNIVNLLLLILLLLIVGCATKRYSETGTKQPRSSKPYTVKGKRYEPMASSDGFAQEGVASSYGRDFHGRKTSNGELFDMHAMTAAHKTLPLGVYVRVEHKKSGKEVVVRINDRGPFVGDRIIDLSEGAASRLGMLQEGIAPVRIAALGYKSGNSFQQPADYDKGTYAIQVGAFTVKENAYRYMEALKKKYGTADVQESWVKGTRYYRVRLGKFNSLKVAQANEENYEQKGFDGCYVVALD